MLHDDDAIFHSWIKLSSSCCVLVYISKDQVLYELRNKEILATCPLKSTDKASGRNESIINETWGDLMMDTDDKEKGTVKFRAFFSYDSGKQRHLHYLILIHETLYIVERKTLKERSDLVLVSYYDHVIDYRVEDEASTGHPSVRIYRLDGSNATAEFIAGRHSKSTTKSGTSENEELSRKSSILTSQLQMQRSLHQKLFQSIGADLKFGPAVDDMPRSECLVRYGDPWKRIHNDQLVIGIPVLNASTR